MRNDPKRSLDGLQQTRLSNCFLANDDQLDRVVRHRIFLKRTQILTHISGAFGEVRRDVDERVAGERDAAQSTESGYRDRQL